MRTDSSQSQNIGWLSLAIFTIVLAIFVIPSTTEKQESAFSAMSIMFEKVLPITVPIASQIDHLLDYGKVALKYCLIFAYLWLIFKKINAYLNSRKLKKV